MLKGCARFLIAPSTPVWSLTGSTSIGCSALNFLEGDVCRIVAQPTGSPIDQCEITQRDHLNIFRLAAPHADMSFTTVSHFRIGILGNSLSFVITCLTCPRSLESGDIDIVKSSMNMFEELALRSTEDISCLAEASRIVTTSDCTLRVFLVADMIDEVIDRGSNQERMIAFGQPFSQALTLIRFSLEFLGVFRHSELNSIVSDFPDHQKSYKTKQTLFHRLIHCMYGDI